MCSVVLVKQDIFEEMCGFIVQALVIIVFLNETKVTVLISTWDKYVSFFKFLQGCTFCSHMAPFVNAVS